jgi:anaerobic magnesium-protoporphyrin IX monomethyl ester cyclase
MAKVVLLSPPFVEDYMRNARCDFVSLSHSSWYPIWLGEAGCYLELKGHETRLLDAQINGLTHQQTLDEIKAFDADLVAIYTGRMSEDNDINFADKIAETGRAVVFIGPYTSIDPKKVLEKSKHVKLAIKKEFDLPLEELASGADPKKTPNFFVKDLATGEIKSTEARPLIQTETLDQFPLTSEYFHRQLDIFRYKTPSELYPFMDVMSGRGCAWGRCNFCLWVQSFIVEDKPGAVYNIRSIDRFIEEFDYIHNFMPEIKSVMIQDDMLTNKRAVEISTAILERGYKIRWSCYAKPNSKMGVETFKLMRKSGCLNLHVGFESGDPQVLENIDKGATVEDSKTFARDAHSAGLNIHGDFAMGHLGDTSESMQRTINLAKEINPHTAQFQIMIPFKNTTYWRQLDELNAWSENGEPSFEKSGGATSEEIRQTAKSGYRQFYISPSYLKKIMRHPLDYFFNRFDEYIHAIPAVTWRRWMK